MAVRRLRLRKLLRFEPLLKKRLNESAEFAPVLTGEQTVRHLVVGVAPDPSRDLAVLGITALAGTGSPDLARLSRRLLPSYLRKPTPNARNLYRDC